MALAIRASLWQEWLSVEQFPASLAAYLLKRFRFLIVFDLQADAFSNSIVRELSANRLTAVRQASLGYRMYDIPSSSREVCGPFAGLSFAGPAAVSDTVLLGNPASFQPLIRVGDQSIFARVDVGTSDVFFLTAALADLDMDVGRRGVSDYFAGLVPLVMFVRHAFKSACWQPAKPATATLIIDDPPLWPRYGFVEFERLVRLMDANDFHTTIAFIPYYWNRAHREAVALFQQRPDRLSLCYHGNDHMPSEFSSQNALEVASMVRTAVGRMNGLEVRSGLRCEKVMVFPHGAFSRQAMSVLRSSNFVAAVNSSHAPTEYQVPLRIRDVMQPCAVTFGGFPLFLRKYPSAWTPEDVALHILFGRPIIIVEHHGGFRNPESLLEVILMLNQRFPEVQWCSVQAALENAVLMRGTSEHQLCIRPYALRVRVRNEGSTELHCVVEWPNLPREQLESVSIDGSPTPLLCESDATRVSDEVGPGTAKTISVVYRAELPTKSRRLPVRKALRVHTRRRLTEVKDNYLSRSPLLLAAAQSMYERYLRQSGVKDGR